MPSPQLAQLACASVGLLLGAPPSRIAPELALAGFELFPPEWPPLEPLEPLLPPLPPPTPPGGQQGVVQGGLLSWSAGMGTWQRPRYSAAAVAVMAFRATPAASGTTSLTMKHPVISSRISSSVSQREP